MLFMAFLSFLTLGLHEGSIGVAWPSVRDFFGVPLDFLGIILVMVTAGVIVSSFASGFLMKRIQFGSLLAITNLIRAAGLLGYVFAAQWWMVVGSAFLVGLGSGVIDSGMNTFVGARYTTGILNWLHAFFGLGAMISPIIMSSLIAAGLSWRLGFVVVAAVQMVLVVYFLANRKQWSRRLLLANRDNGEDIEPAPFLMR